MYPAVPNTMGQETRLPGAPSSRGTCAWQGALSRLPAHTSLLAIADLIAILGCGVDIGNLVGRSNDEPVVA